MIILVKMNPYAPSMDFGEQIQNQQEEKKVFAKIVSSLNQIKMESLKKETIKGEMSTIALVLMAIYVQRIRKALGFKIEKMPK